MQDTVEIFCPYCGEANEIFVDYSAGELQNYQEDCQICCRPWELTVQFIDEEPRVSVSQSGG